MATLIDHFENICNVLIHCTSRSSEIVAIREIEVTSFNFWRRLITTWNIFWVKIGFLFDFVWPNFQIKTYFSLTFSKLVQNLSSCSWSHLLMSNKNAINAYPKFLFWQRYAILWVKGTNTQFFSWSRIKFNFLFLFLSYNHM